jgi:hypothetical protein
MKAVITESVQAVYGGGAASPNQFYQDLMSGGGATETEPDHLPWPAGTP